MIKRGHAASVLLLALSLGSVHSLVSVSRFSSAILYGSVIDLSGQIQVNTGVDYKGDYKHLTQTGAADSDCWVSVGDARGFDRKVFDSPAMCLDVNVLGTGNTDTTRPEGLPEGVVAAMAGQQAMLLSLTYKGEYLDVRLDDPVKLPFEHFPVVVTTDNYLGGVYVALHNTNGIAIAPASDQDSADELKNTVEYLQSLTQPEKLPGTGDYSPKIFKYDIIEKKPMWQTTFTTVNGRSSIGGMEVVLSRNKLVVVGSSTGSGQAVGAGAISGGDWDGYLTLVDMFTGDVDTKNTTTEINAPYSVRIATQPEKDDFVLNVCTSDDKAYIVGSTTGKIEGDVDGGGFVAKFDIDTLDIIWKHQFVGMGIEATHCDVVGDLLYVGGHVPPGLVLDPPNSVSNRKASDNTDIFISLFSPETGTLKWVRQIDSLREDQLVNMVINVNTVLFLTANAMDSQKGTNDVFLLTVTPAGVHDWQNIGEGVDPIEGAFDTASPDNNSGGDKTEEPVQKTVGDWVIPVAIAVPVLLLFALICYYFKTKDTAPASFHKSQQGGGAPIV